MKNKIQEKMVAKALSKYKYSDACKKDVLAVLKRYNGLVPQMEKFVFNNGDEKILLNLNGTIPVEYKGATYNIPVCFWLLDEYPTQPPMCYVKPTQDMQIKTSDKVDATGRISLIYLSVWNHKESNLLSVIQICTGVFSKAPPVFSKPVKRLQRATSSSSSCSTTTANKDENGGDTIEIDDTSTREVVWAAVESRLKIRLDEEVMKTKAEVDSLHSTSKELLDGQEQINSIESDLRDRIQNLEKHKSELTDRYNKMVEACESLSDRNVEVDEIVVLTSPLHKQILNAYVEDAAAEDAIYILGEALRQGRLDCQSYLKRVRNISRKQFMHRAIMDRGRQILGLPS